MLLSGIIATSKNNQSVIVDCVSLPEKKKDVLLKENNEDLKALFWKQSNPNLITLSLNNSLTLKINWFKTIPKANLIAL